MSNSIRIVFLEDVDSDADIIQRELRKIGKEVEIKWVKSKEQYRIGLGTFQPHVVVSDHSMPGFNSVDAFKMLKEFKLNIPFILVTATMSEEFAVSMMREGIADYLLKDRLQRLPAAVTNALEKWQAEREKQASLDLLINSEKRFRALIENSHDMIGLSDSDLKPLYLSMSYTRITGRTLDEEQEGGLDFIHPDDRIEYYRTVNAAKATSGQYHPLQYRLLHKNGRYIWVEGTVINMLHDEAINGLLFNLRDVTARKAAEESLQKSQAHLTAVIENSNVSIYSIDRQFRYISFNSLLKNNLKQIYSLDIKVGDVVFDFLKLLDPTEVDAWRKIYTEALTGNRVEFEKEFSVGDYYACLSFSVNPIIEGHYVTGLSCFAWDITNQKQASKKVTQNEARYRALIENNYDAIVMRDANMQITYSSPSVKRMLGYAPEETYNEPYDRLLHPDDKEVVAQTYKKMMQHPNVPFPLTIRIRRKNGTFLWSEGVMTNMLNNENVKGFVSNFRDITERKEDELQREKITLDLLERNKNLEQYAYIVSHNLRGPVANILGISNLLESEGANAQDKAEALNHLFVSARRLDEVIKDLNMVLQMRQSINEQKEDVDLAEMVNDIKQSIPELVRKSNVEIGTDFKVPAISTVKSYLYSIFYNLITNSIKYKKEGVRPTVTISSELVGDHIHLKFIDNGLGIDLAAHGDKIFGLYKRFHLDHAEGKGIGLFMTKAQVEALGGRISVKSQVNIGTKFTIEL